MSRDTDLSEVPSLGAAWGQLTPPRNNNATESEAPAAPGRPSIGDDADEADEADDNLFNNTDRRLDFGNLAADYIPNGNQ